MTMKTFNQNSKLVKVALASMTLCFSNAVYAQNTNASVAKVPAVEAPAKSFGLDLSLSYSSNMFDQGQYDRTAGTTIELTPSYKFTENLTGAILGSITQQETGQRDVEAANTIARLAYKIAQITPELSLLTRLDGVAPTNKVAKETDRLQGAVGTAIRAIYDNKNVTLPFKVTAHLGLQRNFHEYNVNAENKRNNEYGITESLTVVLKPVESVSLTALGIYRIGISYDGPQKYTFETGLEAGYDITEALSVSLGVSNNGSALKPNGIDSNISFLNEKTSEVSLGLGYTY